MNPDCEDLFAVGGEKNGLKLWNKQTGIIPGVPKVFGTFQVLISADL